MTEAVIRVENLGKRYVLGQSREASRYKTLREGLTDLVKSPFRRASAPPPAEDFWALKNVSFEVQRGDVVGIVGRNGAGKSTLLKILSRITEPTDGRIALRGRVASLLEVGTGFHPELTGRENIFLNGAILGMSRVEIKAKFDEIVAFAEVAKFLDTPVKRYSSGMYVRLAFAVAAHLEPEILIVDEVLAVGDGEFQKKCLGKMESVSKGEGRTVIFVSHQMEAVRSLCKRCIYLRAGQVQAVGGSAEIVQTYLDDQRHAKAESWTQRQVDPNKPVSIGGFYVLNDAGGTRVVTGDDCRFVLEVRGRVSFPRLRVAFGVDDKFGRRLFTLDSSKYYFSFDAMPGINRFVCRVRGLPLKPDVYRVHLFLGNDYEAYDYVDGDAQLTVEAANFYPNPQVDEGHGPVFLAQEWMIDETSSAAHATL